jgi:release factor glutamine methyltransferase
MVKRRVAGEPFQHIIGTAPFYGRDFIVNSNVLIPRTETGVLINRMKENGKVSSLLDVGTGSGCIAITCALENLSKIIYATDICSKALNVAHKNIQLHNTKDIQVICHNILNKGFIDKFDVVISNPPYISVYEMDSLQAEVRGYDPEKALTDGSDGYVFYRRFSELFDDLLNPLGFMLLEIGGNAQKDDVEKIFSDAGLQTVFFRDSQDDFRVVEVRK